MKYVMAAKGGSVFRTREYGRGNASGESGETEGVVRHLLERGDVGVVYFGSYRGEPLPGLEVVEPELEGASEMMTSALQLEQFAANHRALGDRDWLAFVHTAGYSPTYSHIDNPAGATVQAAAVRYQAPMLDAMQHFGIPRVVINNDPRTLPRDQEMSNGWPHCRPAALLGQTERVWNKVVGGRRYECHEVFARAESWAHQEPEDNTGEHACRCVAHAHFRTGIKNDDPDHHSAWQRVLGQGKQLPDGFTMDGFGWEHWSGGEHWEADGAPPKYWVGLKAPDALEVFRTTECGPVVSHTPDFLTGKPFVMASKGCLPILFGDGSHPYTYDPRGVLLPLDHWTRLKRPGDLANVVRALTTGATAEEHQRQTWADLNLEPDWTLLDSLVDDLVAGRAIDHTKYGGYT